LLFNKGAIKMEIITAVGVIATFIGICIAISAYFNGKHIKSGVAEIGKMIDGIKTLLNEIHIQGEQRHREIMKMMEIAEQTHREMMEIAEQRHREMMEIAEQRHREVIQLIASIKGSGRKNNA